MSVNNKVIAGYSALTVFCMIFSAVYEFFSHSVYSPYMIGLFLVPLIFGVAPLLIMKKLNIGRGGHIVRTLHMWMVLTLTVGCCLSGVFQIYGTTSAYIGVYWIAGMVLLLATGIGFLRKGLN